MSDSKTREQHYRHWHLARNAHEAATTDFEWALTRFQQAFERYVSQLASITGLQELSFPEVVILHVIRMQDRPKTAATIARQVNRDDIPNIQYSLRKLVKLELARTVRESGGKIFAYEVTCKGRALLDRYAEIRSEVLTEQTRSIENVDEKLGEAKRLLSLLTGVYDEAGRISAAYSSVHPEETGED